MTVYSDDKQAEMLAEVQRHFDEYLSSGGVKGHIIDMNRFVEGPEFATMLLLRTTGRKSGKKFITPLLYGNWVGHAVIGATYGGSDTPPQWYLNIKAGGETAFQIGTQAFRAAAHDAEGEEYDKIWEYMTRQAPIWIEYQKATTRKIPVVMLKPLEEIPVFKPGE